MTAMPLSHRFSPSESERIGQRVSASASQLVAENQAQIVADIEATALDKGPDVDAVVTITTKTVINYDPKTRRVAIDSKIDWKREVKHSETAEPEVIDLRQMKLKGVDA